VIHIYNGVLFSHKEEWNYIISGKLMKLENYMLNKINQAQKDKYCMFSLVGGIKA
jgi:hypothetical protein